MKRASRAPTHRAPKLISYLFNGLRPVMSRAYAMASSAGAGLPAPPAEGTALSEHVGSATGNAGGLGGGGGGGDGRGGCMGARGGGGRGGIAASEVLVGVGVASTCCRSLRAAGGGGAGGWEGGGEEGGSSGGEGGGVSA